MTSSVWFGGKVAERWCKMTRGGGALKILIVRWPDLWMNPIQKSVRAKREKQNISVKCPRMVTFVCLGFGEDVPLAYVFINLFRFAFWRKFTLDCLRINTLNKELCFCKRTLLHINVLRLVIYRRWVKGIYLIFFDSLFEENSLWVVWE